MEATDRSTHLPRHPMTILERTARREELLAELQREILTLLDNESRSLSIPEIEHSIRARRLEQPGSSRGGAFDLDTYDVRDAISELKSEQKVEYSSKDGARLIAG